ncbi:hypothetical protein Suden_0231 [Sulfurimonas denitrificans DSM 1251]|jgi:hypothetical protein|uniref:Uncharacterized protein n=1 Tax=Sulfurimonas denitrificans (strain ATCC 33889 / DSM 1251) TaxID=326298 RepID=Q30U19_SULDN|nr:hypothetical protein [Sulfurimonas denitrificans]ABB43512.1 hypothetical protein Suden_0231 [Sulfurimonas denitrificans DSM 1251]
MKSILESLVAIIVVGTIFMGILYLLKLGINHTNSFDMDEKVEAFENQKTLLCSTGITNNQKLLVNKNNNWEIYKEKYFKREDMLLEIRICMVEE